MADAPEVFVNGVVFDIIAIAIRALTHRQQQAAGAGHVQVEGVVALVIEGAFHITLDITGFQRPAHADPGGLCSRTGLIHYLAIVAQSQAGLQTTRPGRYCDGEGVGRRAGEGRHLKASQARQAGGLPVLGVETKEGEMIAPTGEQVLLTIDKRGQWVPGAILFVEVEKGQTTLVAPHLSIVIFDLDLDRLCELAHRSTAQVVGQDFEGATAEGGDARIRSKLGEWCPAGEGSQGRWIRLQDTRYKQVLGRALGEAQAHPPSQGVEAPPVGADQGQGAEGGDRFQCQAICSDQLLVVQDGAVEMEGTFGGRIDGQKQRSLWGDQILA